MATIPLRSYIHEIENLIEAGQVDEAVAHCRHILQIFPKHLSAYRMLGKAYLENQRYGDAADIFQRILSAVPDDFVSHVGMSIIREDEGNQDAAIWHMERAFEVQPYNSAIQDEIKRLYGRRDGMEPPKVRLTRGALARMYARGDLYQQAISELRSALSEDPGRPDLQVLLARMYFLNGNKIEAVESSSSLIKKLPFCLEANRILSAVLSETERKEDKQVYQQRVMSMDPYLVHAPVQAPNADNVPANTVTVERLEWKPGQSMSDYDSQPAWAASLGVQVDPFKSSDDSLPEWLSSSDQGTDALNSEDDNFTSPFTEAEDSSTEAGDLPDWLRNQDAPSASDESANDDIIPEWMKEAGWKPSSGTAEEPPPVFEADDFDDFEESGTAEGEIAQADIPDWLQAMAPEGEEEAAIKNEPDEVPDWLQASAPEASDTITTWLDEKKNGPVEQQETGGEELAPDISPKADVPDWLMDLAEETGEGIPESSEAVEDEFPDLGRVKPEVPDWLSGIGEESTSEEVEAEVPDWVKPDAGEEENASELPDWLKEIASEEEITGEGEAEDLKVELPRSPVEEIEVDAVFDEQETGDAEIPVWLRGIDPGADAEGEGDNEVDLPEQLEAAVFEDTIADEEESVEKEHEASEVEVPDRTQETAPAEDADEEIVESEPKTAPGHELNLDDPDSAMAWLESLAAKQGVPEEELITHPDDRLDSPPDWILETDEADIEPAVSLSETEETDLSNWLTESTDEPEDETEAAVTSDDLETGSTEIPDWLRAMAPAEEAGVEEEEPTWLTDQLEPDTDEDVTAADEGQDEFEAIEAELPDWLTEAVPGDEAELVSEEDVLEGLSPEISAEIIPSEDEILSHEPADEVEPLGVEEHQPKEETKTPEILESSEPTPVGDGLMDVDLNDMDAAMAWLESLASKQGVAEEELVTRPEDRSEKPPVWVSREEQKLETATDAEQAPVKEDEAVEEIPAGEAIGEFLAETEEVSGMEKFEDLDEAALDVASEAAGEEELTVVEMPDWIKDRLTEEEREEVEFGEAEQAEIQVEAVPEEMAPRNVEGTFNESEGEPEQTDSEEETVEAGVEAADIDWNDMDSAMAWLENLAARQGVAEEELITKPEERSETPPDWVRDDSSMTGDVEPAQVNVLGDSQPISLPPQTETSEEVHRAEETEEPVEAAVEEPVGLTEEQLDVDIETRPGEELDVPEAVQDAGTDDEGMPELPEWLQEETTAQDIEPEAEPELPGWLAEAAVEAQDSEDEWTPPEVPQPADLMEPEKAPAQVLDINTASLIELERLPGMGYTRAQQILEYRQANGPFQSIDELANVAGIDASLLDSLQNLVIARAEETRAEPQVFSPVGPESDKLSQARSVLSSGEVDRALGIYDQLIKQSAFIDEVIRDLKDELYRRPNEFTIWQTLGDAYMRNGQLQEALDSYSNAEELLR